MEEYVVIRTNARCRTERFLLCALRGGAAPPSAALQDCPTQPAGLASGLWVHGATASPSKRTQDRIHSATWSFLPNTTASWSKLGKSVVFQWHLKANYSSIQSLCVFASKLWNRALKSQLDQVFQKCIYVTRRNFLNQRNFFSLLISMFNRIIRLTYIFTVKYSTLLKWGNTP